MPVYDNSNPLGPAGPALWATATLLSGLTNFQLLAEAADAAAALARIAIGIQQEPDNHDQFSLPELKNEFFQANLHPAVPSQSIILPGTGAPSPMIGGAFRCFLRRHVRASEVSDFTLRNGLYLWFHDAVTAVEYDLLAAAEAATCPRLRGIQPEVDGAFNEFTEESAQGEYLWASFFVLWGDEVEA